MVDIKDNMTDPAWRLLILVFGGLIMVYIYFVVGHLKYKRSNRGTPKSLHLSPKTSNRNRKFLSFDLYCCK